MGNLKIDVYICGDTCMAAILDFQNGRHKNTYFALFLPLISVRNLIYQRQQTPAMRVGTRVSFTTSMTTLVASSAPAAALPVVRLSRVSRNFSRHPAT